MPKQAEYADIVAHMEAQRQRLTTLLQSPTPAQGEIAAQPLRAQVALFKRITAGRLDRAATDSQVVQQVETAVEELLHVLYAPLDGGPLIVPRDAWTRTPLMELVAKVAFWLYRDDLISIADAARLRYDTTRPTDSQLTSIRWMLQTGALRHYWRPGRTAKQRAFLVRRSDVLELNQTQGGAV